MIATFRQSATDLFGRRPDDLGVMPDIGPIAGARDFGKSAGAEMALLVDKTVHHVLDRVITGGAHPQVFACPAGTLGLGMFENLTRREKIGPFLRIACQFVVPVEAAQTAAGAFLVMRGDDSRRKIAMPVCRQDRRRQPHKNRDDEKDAFPMHPQTLTSAG